MKQRSIKRATASKGMDRSGLRTRHYESRKAMIINCEMGTRHDEIWIRFSRRSYLSDQMFSSLCLLGMLSEFTCCMWFGYTTQ